MMKNTPITQEAIESKLAEINAIRRVEYDIRLSAFKRGQLSGAQQALYWQVGQGLDPIRAFLTDEELAQTQPGETPPETKED